MDNHSIIKQIIKNAKKNPCSIDELAKRISDSIVLEAKRYETYTLIIDKGCCPICIKKMSLIMDIGQMEYFECDECNVSVSYKNGYLVQIKFNDALRQIRNQEESKWMQSIK